MTTYIDTSVLLRRLFGEPHPLAAWSKITLAYASRILWVEVARSIDRCRLDGEIDDRDVETLVVEAKRLVRSIDLLAVTEAIWQRAAQPMPTVVGSLDAIHLATALELAKTIDGPWVVATHDGQLARACRASGLEVIGA